MLRQSLVAIVTVLSLGALARSNAPAEDDAKLMAGTWVPASGELAGRKLSDDELKGQTLMIEGDRYTVTVVGKKDEGTVKLDASKKPKQMDITGTNGPNKGKTFLCIYEVEGDTLRVCYDLSGKAYPKEFSTKPKTILYLVSWQRKKS
jgi:uncharacterized protein (TIGR03067 family)